MAKPAAVMTEIVPSSSARKYLLSPIQETFATEVKVSRPQDGFDFGFNDKSDDFYGYDDDLDVLNGSSDTSSEKKRLSADTNSTLPSSPLLEDEYAVIKPLRAVASASDLRKASTAFPSLAELRSHLHRVSSNSGGTMTRDVSIEDLDIPAHRPRELEVPQTSKWALERNNTRENHYNPNHIDLRHQLQPRTKRMSFDHPILGDISVNKRASSVPRNLEKARPLERTIAQLEHIEKSQPDLMASLESSPVKPGVMVRRGRAKSRAAESNEKAWRASIIENKMELVPQKAVVKVVRQGDRLDKVEQLARFPEVPRVRAQTIPKLRAADRMADSVAFAHREMEGFSAGDVKVQLIPPQSKPEMTHRQPRSRHVQKSLIGMPVLQHTTATRIPTIPLDQARNSQAILERSGSAGSSRSGESDAQGYNQYPWTKGAQRRIEPLPLRVEPLSKDKRSMSRERRPSSPRELAIRRPYLTEGGMF